MTNADGSGGGQLGGTLEHFPGLARGINEEGPSRFRPTVLPGMRDATWHERACARAARTEIVTNFEAILHSERTSLHRYHDADGGEYRLLQE
jgi:hypothetical protein